VYGFLFTFYSNYGRIVSHFGDIQRQERPDLESWVVYSLSNGAILNDLEQPLTRFSRSRYTLTLNISNG